MFAIIWVKLIRWYGVSILAQTVAVSFLWSEAEQKDLADGWDLIYASNRFRF